MLGFHLGKLQGFKLIIHLWASDLFWCCSVCTCLTAESKYSFTVCMWDRETRVSWLKLSPCSKLKLSVGFRYNHTFVYSHTLSFGLCDMCGSSLSTENSEVKGPLWSVCSNVSGITSCSCSESPINYLLAMYSKLYRGETCGSGCFFLLGKKTGRG